MFIFFSLSFDAIRQISAPLHENLRFHYFKFHGGFYLKTINLRDYYPHYKEDEFYEVPDAVADLLDEFERREEAYRIYTLRYKAYYSLEADDGIEKSILLTVPSPNEVLEQERKRALILRGLAMLPEKQRRRIYAHYFLGISITKIAKKERVHRSRVYRSIEAGLEALEKFFEKIS